MSEPCCPRCHEPVRLPTVIPAPDATARCPWCSAQFALREVTGTLPPMLELVSPDRDDAATVAGGSALADLDSDSHWDAPFANEVDDDAVVVEADEAFAFAEDTAARPPAAGPAQVHLATRPRTQRRMSPVKMLVQWVGGGVAGIAIALGILYGLGKAPNLGFWPFDGPTATRSAQPAPRPQADIPPRDQRQPEAEELALPDFQALGGDMSDDLDAPAAVPMPAGEGNAAEPAEPAEPAAEIAAAAEPPEQDADGDAPAAEEAPSPALSAAISEAQQASAELDRSGATGSERARLRSRLYTALAEAGELGEPAADDHYRQLFDQLRSAEQLTELGGFARSWYGAQQRPSDGLFATGTLRQQEADNGFVLDWGVAPFLILSGVPQAVDDPESLVGQFVALIGKIDGTVETPTAAVVHLERLEADDDDGGQN